MKDIFAERNTGYNLRHGNDSQLPKVHTTTYGIETISFLGNRLWSTLPNIFKQASTLPIFKNHIKCWKGESCNCRLCKIYCCSDVKDPRVLGCTQSSSRQIIVPVTPTFVSGVHIPRTLNGLAVSQLVID